VPSPALPQNKGDLPAPPQNGFSYQPLQIPPTQAQAPQQQFQAPTPNLAAANYLVELFKQQLDAETQQRQQSLLESIQLLAGVNPGMVVTTLTQLMQQQQSQQPQLADLHPPASYQMSQGRPFVQAQQQQASNQLQLNNSASSLAAFDVSTPSPFVPNPNQLQLNNPASSLAVFDVSTPSPFVPNPNQLQLNNPASSLAAFDVSTPSPFVPNPNQLQPNNPASSLAAFGANFAGQCMTDNSPRGDNMSLVVPRIPEAVKLAETSGGPQASIEDVKRKSSREGTGGNKKVKKKQAVNTNADGKVKAAQPPVMAPPPLSLPIHTPEEAVLQTWSLEQLGELM
jgi:hypothetical protein